jgi:tetratricopeptide (TPR) repeat protein
MSISESARKHEMEAVQLFRLIQAGGDETEEGDELRDAMLTSWKGMTDQERYVVRGLYRDMHLLVEDEVLDDDAATMDQFREAWKVKDYGLVLQLLRKRRDPQLTKDKAAYFRGLVWGALGYREAALAFMTYAADVNPHNGTYAYLALVNAMDLEHVDAALARAANIEAREDAPIRSLIAAAHALVRFAAADVTHRFYTRAAALLTRAIETESARPPTEQFTGLLTEAHVSLGMCREMLGDADRALESYSDALKLDRRDDVALTARGLLLMSTGKEKDAERDFERAVQSKTPLVWPYLYLAPMYLRRKEYDACIELCLDALRHAPEQEDEQQANFYEWLAIANRARRSSELLVEKLFALAEERAPLNVRIDKNRGRQQDWEVVRDTSLEEIRQRFRESIKRQPPVRAAV